MTLDTVPSSAVNDAPTNPMFTNTAFSDNDRIYTAIVPNGDISFNLAHFAGSVTEYSNLNNTKGFRVKCYDALTNEGVEFNPADFNTGVDATTYDYFVLLYSDDDYKHHFAKIKEIITEDVVGDAFEFEPKLGNEIPKNTKFMIFKGPTKSTDVVALSAGILQDSTSANLETNLVCARPLFYFYGGLDKEGELDHNTKYYTMQNGGTAATYLLDSTVSSPKDNHTFRTVQDFGKTIVDYGKHTLRVTLTDKLRDLDIASGGSTTTNEGNSVSLDYGDYEAAFPNARRDANDELTSLSYTGPSRYLHYDYSPLRANFTYGVYSHKTYHSVNGRGGFSETKIVDTGRILAKKIEEFTDYKVRHLVHRASLDEWFALEAKVTSDDGSHGFTFNTEYDLDDFINVGDELKIDGRIYVVQTIGSFSSFSQTITMRNRSRLENEVILSSGYFNPTLEQIVYRRAYNFTDKTLMVDFDLINNRFSKLSVSFVSLNMEELFATVSAVDANKKMITLSFSEDSYYGDSLRYTAADFLVHVERFNGEVEEITSKKENSQTIFEVKGRDKFNKLISPVVNLNSLFSEDIIYSTNSPYNKLSQIDSTTLSIALGDTTKATGIAVSDFDIVPAQGDKIFTANGYIGEILTATGDPLTITFTAALTEANSEIIYIDTEKNYMFGKALGSSHLANKSPTSLTGGANKGVFFTGGQQIDIATGNELNTLVGTSSHQNPNSIGYAINSPSSISNDRAFQAKLHDEFGSGSPATFETVNTLIDFEVVSTSKKDNVTEIELAPYIPVTLGRKMPNFGNAEGYILTPQATIEHTGSNINSSRPNIIEAADDSIKNIDRNDPVFIGESTTTAKFAGFVRTKKMIRGTASQSNLLYLDRDFTTTAGHNIYSVSKDTHDLFFINGAHLWGGKVLSLPHSKLTALGAVPLNIENIYGSNTDTSKKYGQPYYKSIAQSKGNFNLLRIAPSKTFVPFKETYENASAIKYHNINYKFAPNTASNNKNAYDKTGSGDDIHMDIDMRGFGSAYGSLFNGNTRVRRNQGDEDKYPDFFTSNVYDNEDLINSLAQKVTPAATLFLYINSDILPYSSLRKDSLMDGNKNLTSYNLFLLENKQVKDKSLEYTETSSGNQILLSDNSFQTISIAQNTDISSLKRFGLMRLTELCFDIHYNLFNPEQNTVKDSNFITATQFRRLKFAAVGTLSSTTITNSLSASATSLILDTVESGNNPATGNTLYDANYKLIGTVSSYNSGTKTITLTSSAQLNDDGTFTVGTVYESTNNDIIYIQGTKDENTFITQDNAHIQKGALVTGSYQNDTGDAWYAQNANTVLNLAPSSAKVVSPIRFKYSNSADALESSGSIVPSRSFSQQFAGIINIFNHNTVVILDTYDIEDGQKHPVEKGVVVPITLGDVIHFDDGTNYTDLIGLGSAVSNFKYKYPDETANSLSTSSPYEATGIKMGLKPRIWYDASEHDTKVDITSSNGTLYHYGFNAFDEKLGWMDFIDLTGCYLVSEAGKDTILRSNVVSGSESTTSARTMEGVIPDDLIYVISHTVTNSGTRKQNLILDKELTDEEAYRVLKPNETTFYDFSPKQISLNMLSSSYTKMSGEDKMYNVQQDIDIVDGKQGRSSSLTGPRGEAFLSMYVAIDPDKQSSSEDYLVMRRAQNFLEVMPQDEYNILMSDGENKISTSLGIKQSVEFTGETEVIFDLGDVVKMDGVVSFSETFTLTTSQDLKIDPSRACIGSTATVCLEAEDLINELFEDNGIDFTISNDTDYPYYLAPNFKGVDLYSAIRYIMEKKDFTLVEENGTFSVTQSNDSSHYSNIVLNGSSKFKIFEFERATTLFDFYNEIIVYGNTHKAERKDLRSVQKRGRKTLEHHDKTLITQEEVNKKAIDLLRIHSTFNKKLIMTVGHEGLSQLRAGDIINVEIEQENIEIGQYMVLQIEHELTGLMRLELGRYSKQLSDLFSELLVTQKQINSNLRNDKFNEKSVSYNFLETLNIKELRLLIRKRQSVGGFTLGFGQTLNTGSNPLGFNGGTVTITELYEEDLA